MQAWTKARMIRMIILGALGALGPQGAQVHCDGSAQKMNPPQKIALFGKMAPRGPPWAPENGAPWAPWAPQGPRPPRAPWGVVILATRMIILTTRMIILMLWYRPGLKAAREVGGGGMGVLTGYWKEREMAPLGSPWAPMGPRGPPRGPVGPQGAPWGPLGPKGPQGP